MILINDSSWIFCNNPLLEQLIFKLGYSISQCWNISFKGLKSFNPIWNGLSILRNNDLFHSIFVLLGDLMSITVTFDGGYDRLVNLQSSVTSLRLAPFHFGHFIHDIATAHVRFCSRITSKYYQFVLLIDSMPSA